MNPNPDIYGQPENYIVTPRLLYRDNTALLSQTGAFEFPKSPNFGGTETDYRGELRRGIQQNKIHLNESLDLSICGIGQDKAVSAYGNWQIWRIDRNGNNPKPVRDKYFSLDENVNTFFYAGWYNSGSVERFHTLWTRTNYDNGRFMCWSPNAEQSLDSSSVNTNVFEYPIATYGSKAIIGTAWVGLFDTSRPDLGLNWIKLEQWKTNSTQTIAGIALELATPKDITGGGDSRKIIYTPHTETTEYGEYQRVSAALLNTIDERIDYSMLMPSDANSTVGETGVNLLSLYNYSKSSVTCPEDTRVYIPCEGLFENDNIWWSWSKYEGGGDNIYIARVIPYSDNNYEAIMRMIACFGIPFVTKTKDLEFNMLTGWSDTDLYFPVIDDAGICHGEYTHGADNLTNPFNDLTNVREKNYDPYAKHYGTYCKVCGYGGEYKSICPRCHATGDNLLNIPAMTQGPMWKLDPDDPQYGDLYAIDVERDQTTGFTNPNLHRRVSDALEELPNGYLHLPGTHETIDYPDSEYCSVKNFDTDTILDVPTITKYNGSQKYIEMSEVFVEKGYTTIGNGCFTDTDVVYVEIPEGVTTIK